MVAEVANSDLKSTDVPEADASWAVINDFAHTFNGYKAFDGTSGRLACHELAMSRQAHSLSELRASLFYEMRRARESGEMPAEEWGVYVRSLVWRIREHVRCGFID